MKKILAFGASNTKDSINKKLAKFTALQIKNAEVTILDLNDFEMELFSIDREKELGIPNKAKEFKRHLQNSDGIIISFAENNGCYSVAFKNIFDWVSRLEKANTWSNKFMFLLSTAPGLRGGITVLDLAVKTFPFEGGKIAANFLLPCFNKNFSDEKGITNIGLQQQFTNQLNLFQQKIFN